MRKLFFMLIIGLFMFSMLSIDSYSKSKSNKKSSKSADGEVHEGGSSGGGNASKFGLGILFGDSVMFTGKYWMDSDTAIDFAIGEWHYNWGIEAFVDYVWHFEKTDLADKPFYLYLSVGGLLHQWDWKDDYYDRSGRKYANNSNFDDHPDGVGFGVKGAFGVDWYVLKKENLGIFAELGPEWQITPFSYWDWMFGIGVRFYF